MGFNSLFKGLSSTEKFSHEYILNGTSKFVVYVGGNVFLNYVTFMDKNILISFIICGHYVLMTVQGPC
jgi:hypothetical protein